MAPLLPSESTATVAAPSFASGTSGRIVREALAEAGYRESEVTRVLGATSWGDVTRLPLLVAKHAASRASPPLRSLLEIFHLGKEVPVAEGRTALGPVVVDALVETRLVEVVGERLRANVRLSPMGELVLASDPSERHRSGASDFVLGPGGITHFLAGMIPPGPIGSALDLGCGAGSLGATLAAGARHVLATDVNPRAVAFARFNAELNDLKNLECREGSLFDPVAGERFDLIACNPPYVISPASTYVYRDGGTDLCRRIVQEAPAHLSPGGTLLMTTEWPEGTGRDWSDEVAAWCEGTGCDAWVLRIYSHSPPSYASVWLSQQYSGAEVPQDVFDAWTNHLVELGIGAVGGGLLVMRPVSDRPVRFVAINAPLIRTPAGASLERWLRARSLADDTPDDTALMARVLVPSPELVRRDERRATGAGWESQGPELRMNGGLGFRARVDPVAAELVGRLDGSRTVAEALASLTRAIGISPEPFLKSLPGALRRLLELGLLVPEDGAGRNG